MTLRDAAFWTLHVLCSRHVALRGLIIRGSMDYPNNDGRDGAPLLVAGIVGRWAEARRMGPAAAPSKAPSTPSDTAKHA